MILDHPVRHIVQNNMLRAGVFQRIQDRRSTTGAMNAPEVMQEWASALLALSGEHDVDLSHGSASIVEIGPGHSLGVAFLLAGRAGSAYALDVKVAPGIYAPHQFEAIAEAGVAAGIYPESRAVDEVLASVHHRVVDHEGRWPLEDSSIDLVYAFYAGEHMRDPAAVLRESHRVLRPGGLCVWWIDLMDHFHRDDNWLQFLEYDDPLWEAMTSRRGGWCNRLRARQWSSLFTSQFDLVEPVERRRGDLPEGFQRSRLATPFRHMTDAELSSREIRLVGKKRPGRP